ncbi:uncharacterized protein CIMG_09419 [Coccidioides immitis RS]|uniref:Uncharacterized protein n=4 Tax=Coccidioides immitis TaxID=5501 RepID=A0A0E1RW05_COCIM|nr:uncharacterized protein CIMG_09419 [Coccidioides immitis RS]EAS28215.2 hypothetical protein CIMG_09419 [Coccidioides immitis RS]KMP09045.1 hypothetical protein CIRG_08726 [Coccidioides immitis RMSCC 2394]KMU77967.1 hypothetical protein CISG_06877 [Coccidioides immitis RMSCC 3703]KMU85846.1 hypothetical protein CIHG_03374 [Coccidioides immitis H538.4]
MTSLIGGARGITPAVGSKGVPPCDNARKLSIFAGSLCRLLGISSIQVFDYRLSVYLHPNKPLWRPALFASFARSTFRSSASRLRCRASMRVPSRLFRIEV